MLHRFTDFERGVIGSEAAQLRRTLQYLIRHNYECVGLAEVFHRLAGEGPPVDGAVAFTIDDGYVEQASVAAPIFAEFECPVTTFLSTGFVDRALWFWWDQIEYVFRHANRRSLHVELDGTLSYRWETDVELARSQADFIRRCKLAPPSDIPSAIGLLARAAEVEIPRRPPPQYAPMTWDQVRECERSGMTFGPHSVTHPILRRANEDQARREIADSWSRLQAEVGQPLPVFCYPNGGWDDFGEREIAVLRQLGFLGAVVSESGYADAASFREEHDGPFTVPRFGLPDSGLHVIQYVSGAERVKRAVRRRF